MSAVLVPTTVVLVPVLKSLRLFMLTVFLLRTGRFTNLEESEKKLALLFSKMYIIL
jgi:hypothetical protein